MLTQFLDSFRAVTRDVDISPIPDHYKRRVYCSPKGIAHFPVGSKDPRDKTVDKGESLREELSPHDGIH